jgi:hypothetical protein
MCKSRILRVCIVLAGLLNVPVLCQQSDKRPRSPARAATGQRRTSAIPSPVRIDGPSLGPRFVGHDIKAEIAAVKKSPASLPKSEFESTERYQARVSAYTGPEKLAFLLFNEVDRETNVEANYDADAGVLTVAVRPMSY